MMAWLAEWWNGGTAAVTLGDRAIVIGGAGAQASSAVFELRL